MSDLAAGILIRLRGTAEAIAALRREALEHSAVGADGEHRGHDRDPILAGQVGALADVERDHGLAIRAQALLPLAALRAERVRELDVGPRATVETGQVGGIEARAALRGGAAQARGEAVDLPARAKTARRPP